jgi:hypothetical protein
MTFETTNHSITRLIRMKKKMSVKGVNTCVNNIPLKILLTTTPNENGVNF